MSDAQRLLQPSDPGAPVKDLFAGGGEMGALMRSTDWSKTKLGPIEGWPQSLRTMLGVMLGSRFPMLLWWGPELLHLYNDAYRPILRDKHPASLAAPAAEVWAEVWDVAGPMARSVQEGGPATWTEDLQLFINSEGMAEETYFTFSYSPVPGDDGRVGGLLNTVQETTAKVRSQRQIRMLHDLAARAAAAKSEEEAYRIAVETLCANELDIPFVLLYLVNEEVNSARLAAAGGWKDYAGPAKPAHVPIGAGASSGSWPFAEALRKTQGIVIDDLSPRFGPLPMGRWNARPERALLLPLFRAGRQAPYAFLITGISPHRALEDRYREFFRAAADQVANVVASARAYEAEKKRAEALAEIDRAKTTFFSNVSHEFRTPLALILGPVEDALASPSKPLAGQALETVHRSAVRLLRLVNSLLDFARIEAGRLQLSFVPTDLAGLTADLASSFRSLTERAGLKLVVDCPPIPDPVYVDPAQWEKIVLNLLSNAFKFTFKGEITVALRSRGDHVELVVRDTGTGIAKRELPRLFERFHRIEGAAGRSFEGTGIGLSLVHELVKLHGGSLNVSSVEGQGSSFEVSLPTGHSHLPAERVVPHAPAPATRGASPYFLEASQWFCSGRENGNSLDEWIEAPPPETRENASARKQPRVLVVDDNADMRSYLAQLLSTRWQVDAAKDGRDALASARSRTPDLVLSDVMMPGLDGYALLRELRADPRTSRIPVILLSARAGEEAIVEGLGTGPDDYLVKPFASRELLARVQTHLELGSLRRRWLSELETANKELEAFSYSAAHDLSAPLRSIEGFIRLLLARCDDKLDSEDHALFERIPAAVERMSRIIDGLLSLSRIGREEIVKEKVDLSAAAREIAGDLARTRADRRVEFVIEKGLTAVGDPRMLRSVLENLLGNAWKYTSKHAAAKIEFGQLQRDDHPVFFVRDDGAGFDMKAAKSLFKPFHRLHSPGDFPGAGIGLATVERIIARHTGRVWGEGRVEGGAVFYFTL